MLSISLQRYLFRIQVNLVTRLKKNIILENNTNNAHALFTYKPSLSLLVYWIQESLQWNKNSYQLDTKLNLDIKCKDRKIFYTKVFLCELTASKIRAAHKSRAWSRTPSVLTPARTCNARTPLLATLHLPS